MSALALLEGSWRKTALSTYMNRENETNRKLDSLPPGVCQQSRVFCVTEYCEHTCLQSSTATSNQYTTSDEYKRRRSLTSSQLCTLLRPEFEKNDRNWTKKDVVRHIEPVDAGAALNSAGHVLRLLRKSHELDAATEMMFIQGLKRCLEKEGFGVVFHVTDANGVREQLLELARKRYYAEARKLGIKKKGRFNVRAVARTLDSIPETHKAVDGTMQAAQYLVGWTLIPPNNRNGGADNFQPTSALDCASMKSGATGVLIARARKDANSNIQPMSISHVLAAEGELSVGAHLNAEAHYLKEVLNQATHVHIMDGGQALHSGVQRAYPSASILRCSRHLVEDLAKRSKGNEDVKTFQHLVMIPKNHAKAAEQLYNKLSQSCPARNVPKSELCPAFLPDGVCSHGDTTSNDFEILNYMVLGVRRERSLFKTMLLTAQLLRERTISLHSFMTRCKQSCGGSDGRWPDGSVVPAVESEHGLLKASAFLLKKPEADPELEGVYKVWSNSGGLRGGQSAGSANFKWTVSLPALQTGMYEQACGCGKNASSKAICKHVKKVLMQPNTQNWTACVKPWQVPSTWEKQVGNVWRSIDAQDIVDSTEELISAGRLRSFTQPNLDIKKHGKPNTTITTSAASDRRAKSFLEEMKDLGRSVAIAKDVLAGSIEVNRGGTGTKKTCAYCKKAGFPEQYHRQNKCPRKQADRLGHDIQPPTSDSTPTSKAYEHKTDPSSNLSSQRKERVEKRLIARDTFLQNSSTKKMKMQINTPESEASCPGPDQSSKPFSNQLSPIKNEEEDDDANSKPFSNQLSPIKDEDDDDPNAKTTLRQTRSQSTATGAVKQASPPKAVSRATNLLTVSDNEDTNVKTPVYFTRSQPSAQEVIRPTNLLELSDDDDDESKSADDNDEKCLSFFLGDKQVVIGDGFCWLWSVLHAISFIHSAAHPEYYDYMKISRFIRFLQTQVRDGGGPSWMQEKHLKKVASLPHDVQKATAFGMIDVNNFGGGYVWLPLLAHFLRVSIVVIDDVILQKDYSTEKTKKSPLMMEYFPFGSGNTGSQLSYNMLHRMVCKKMQRPMIFLYFNCPGTHYYTLKKQPYADVVKSEVQSIGKEIGAI